MTELIRQPRKDLTYKYGRKKWVIRAEFRGVTNWTTPDDTTGKVRPPYTDFDDYLFAAIDPKQRDDLVAAIGSDEVEPSGKFPEFNRQEAAVAAWRNTFGMTELENKVQKAAKVLDEALAKTTAAAVADALEAESSEVEEHPFSG